MNRSEKSFSTQISVNEIEKHIYTIRDQQVMLDSDIAKIFQMETKVLKRTVRRNIKRFPPDFMFELTKDEQEFLRCQNGTLQTRNESNLAAKPNLRCQNGTLSNNTVSNQGLIERSRTQIRVPRSFISRGHEHFRFAPFAFAEQGVGMLSGIITSETAIEINVSILRAFVQRRKRHALGSTELEDQMTDLERRIRRLEQDKVNSLSTTRLLSDLDAVATIKKTVAYHCGVMVEDLQSTHRSKVVSRARHVAIYLMRRYLRLSFPEMARHFCKDHTSIMYAYQKIEADLQSDKTLREAIVVMGRVIGFS